jgi:ferrous iron transport protein B
MYAAMTHTRHNTTEPKKHPVFAIVGNMNVGKTCLFKALCGSNTHSINMPGSTVSVESGTVRGSEYRVLDTPGIYSIFSSNIEERICRDILLPGQSEGPIAGIILVADAKNMRRSIAIALQYAEYGLPMLMVVNMIDEASSRGITIDTARLSALLGIDVCPTIAREGIGVRPVAAALARMRVPAKPVTFPTGVENFLQDMTKLLVGETQYPRALGLLLLDHDRTARSCIKRAFGPGMLERLTALGASCAPSGQVPHSITMTNLYNRQAERIAAEIVSMEPPVKSSSIVRLGALCSSLSAGIPIALIVLTLVYLFVGTFGATYLVDTINEHIFESRLIPLCERLVAPIPSAFIRDMIVDTDFGLLPTGIFLALGLVLPVLLCFYIAFGFLEDSGYLPRFSLLLDKIFKLMGLNGKGVIPLVMGYSCITMAILTTRMLDTKKERTIATILLLLGTPCAPLLAVMLIVLDRMPFSATLTVFGIIFAQTFIAGLLLNRLLPGRSASLLMEIPPLRIPKPLPVIKMACVKTFHFMKEALPVFMLASVVVFLFDRMGGLARLELLASPLVHDFMGLPDKSVQVFIKTSIRRESGATELMHLKDIYTNVQMVINLLVMAFLLPCINAAIVVIKERGLAPAVAMIGSVMLYAVLVGGALHWIFNTLGITFT